MRDIVAYVDHHHGVDGLFEAGQHGSRRIAVMGLGGIHKRNSQTITWSKTERVKMAQMPVARDGCDDM